MKSPRWSAAESQAVRKHYGRLPVSIIAQALGRGEQSVRCKANRLGLRVCENYKHWTRQEEQRLRDLYPRLGAIRTGLALGRSDGSVARRASALGIRRQTHQSAMPSGP